MAYKAKARVNLGLLRKDTGITGWGLVHQDQFPDEGPTQKGPFHEVTVLPVWVETLRIIFTQKFAPLHFILLFELSHAQQEVVVVDIRGPQNYFLAGDLASVAAHCPSAFPNAAGFPRCPP